MYDSKLSFYVGKNGEHSFVWHTVFSAMPNVQTSCERENVLCNNFVYNYLENKEVCMVSPYIIIRICEKQIFKIYG